MDHLNTLDYALGELRDAVDALDDSAMSGPTNCDPWTVRRLASHALNNQLLWAGLVTGQELVSTEDAVGAVAIEGDLSPVAADVTDRVMALWRSDGVLEALHATPFGELPGGVVIDFALIDAAAHSWDLRTSTGQRLEFDPEEIPALTEVVAVTCVDAAREAGLIKAPADVPADATNTERLMAASGRTIPR